MGRTGKKRSSLKLFDKYEYYSRAVQAPDGEIEMLNAIYEECSGCKPYVLCEDFCGTFANSAGWVKEDKRNVAFGVDLDTEPLDYGARKYLAALKPDQRKRLNILQSDVLQPGLPKGDIVVALNFSYSLFTERSVLLHYFQNSFKRLKRDGVFIVDCFGGPLCMKPIEDIHHHRGFTYYWEQSSFNPVNNHALFYIHFKRPGEKKREKVFTYDWRIWGIPELRDLMVEAGFRRTYVYWEGTTRRGTGDGRFVRSELGDCADSWVAYVVGCK